MSNPAKGSTPAKKGSNGHQKLNFRNNTQALFPVHYSDADAKQVLLAIDAVTRAGGALMFGITSDGGAFSVVVLSSDGKAKEYPHTADELRDTLQAIVEYYTSG